MSNKTVAIRNAVLDDLPALTEIYNEAILAKRCTCDIDVFTSDSRLPWFNAHNNTKTPIYVYCMGGIIVGYSYLSLYRSGRAALKDVAEISYYVRFDYHAQGIGSRLALHTISEAKQLGYTHLIAILLDCNTPSIALLNKLQQFQLRLRIASCDKPASDVIR